MADADVQTTAPYGQVISADLKALVIVGRAGALQASACASIPKKTVVFCHKLRFASRQMEKVRENPFFQTLCGPCVLDCCCGVASSSGATWSVASFQAAEKFAYYSATGQIVSKGVDPQHPWVEFCVTESSDASRIFQDLHLSGPASKNGGSRSSDVEVSILQFADNTHARMERHAVAVFTPHGTHNPKKQFENTYFHCCQQRS